jgi:SRSO17 transposase
MIKSISFRLCDIYVDAGENRREQAGQVAVRPPETPAVGFAHTLLVRRSTSEPDDIRFFLAHAPDPTPMPVLVRGAGTRWKIEEDNRIEKDLLGLDHYQVRTWTSWHHNIVICMLAHAFLAVEQARLARHIPELANEREDPDRGKAR